MDCGKPLPVPPDGSKMIAAGGGGVGSFVFPIYTSSDMGVTWVSINAPVANWQSVASSADGNRLAAADYRDRVIYISTNSGAVWTVSGHQCAKGELVLRDLVGRRHEIGSRGLRDGGFREHEYFHLTGFWHDLDNE